MNDNIDYSKLEDLSKQIEIKQELINKNKNELISFKELLARGLSFYAACPVVCGVLLYNNFIDLNSFILCNIATLGVVSFYSTIEYFNVKNQNEKASRVIKVEEEKLKTLEDSYKKEIDLTNNVNYYANYNIVNNKTNNKVLKRVLKK